MDHAEVVERLEESILGPGTARGLGAHTDPAAADVRRHLAGCASCRAEQAALESVAEMLAAAAPASLRPPPGARDRILGAVLETGRLRGAAAVGAPGVETPALGVVSIDEARARRTGRWSAAVPGRGRPNPVLALAAAAAAILLLVGGAVIGQLLAPREPADEFVAVAADFESLLREPDSKQVQLYDNTGISSGTAVLSPARRQLGVLTSQLPAPPEGRQYGCYLERAGQRTRIGRMHFYGDTAYWVGPVGELPDPGRDGDRFLVILDGLGDAGEPALAGSF